MNKQEFDNATYIHPSGREDREAREKSSTRRFWFLCVPGGALGGFVICLVSGSVAAFFWAWMVITFVLYGISTPEGK